MVLSTDSRALQVTEPIKKCGGMPRGHLIHYRVGGGQPQVKERMEIVLQIIIKVNIAAFKP